MKYFLSSLICVVSAQLLSSNIVFAQTLNLKIAPANIIIDGNIKEWGDSLAYTDDKTKLDYTLANDNDNLYLVIKTKNKEQQTDILGAGITFNVDVKGRNKITYAITYPERSFDQNSFINMDSDQVQLQIQSALYRRIKVDGFSDIDKSLISTSNPNGIRIAIGYDASGYLIYEEIIPLTLFHAEKYLDKEWAFNIKLNGLENQNVQKETDMAPSNIQSVMVAVPSGSPSPLVAAKLLKGGRRPSSASAGSAGNISITKPVDFWGKFRLAKVQ